jgi:hypothetical protein
VGCGNMGRVKRVVGHSMTRSLSRSAAGVAVAISLVLTGCVDPNSQFVTTSPVEDPLIETSPLSDDEVEEEVIVEAVLFDSIEECLQGNWEVNNDEFGAFFAQTDERVVSIDVSGLATMTIDDDTYRMFFDNWGIQYDTGDPTFLISRSGNETVQFVVTDDGTLEVVERDDQIALEFFSIITGGDGEAIAIATTDPGPLPLEGSTLQCTGSTLEIFLEQESFLFDRR